MCVTESLAGMFVIYWEGREIDMERVEFYYKTEVKDVQY